MLRQRSQRFLPLCLTVLIASSSSCAFSAQQPELDVPYVPTPQPVVMEMLKLAAVKPGELVYDLGCGDGRIVITAAKDFGARGVGVDIDPERIKESNANARKAGVTDRVKFVTQDLFEMDFRDADVVTLYLLSSVNLRLRPKLLRELRPGTRVVSHSFDMDDWKPDATRQVRVGSGAAHDVYFWVIPANVAGDWTWEVTTPAGSQRYTMQLRQEFQEVSGTAKLGNREVPIREARLRGDQLTFSLAGEGGQSVQYTGRLSNGVLRGTMTPQGGSAQARREWTARRS